MGSKPRQKEYVTRLVLDKQRAIYWLCAVLEHDAPATRAAARRALTELGYDEPRIEALLLLGEPGEPRAREQTSALNHSAKGGRTQAPDGRDLGQPIPWPRSAPPR